MQSIQLFLANSVLAQNMCKFSKTIFAVVSTN